MQSYLSYKGSTVLSSRGHGCLEVWHRPQEGYLHPEAHGRLMLGPSALAPVMWWQMDTLGSPSVGLGSPCCLAPLSAGTRALTLPAADMEKKKKVLKNAIEFVRLEYFRHHYQDTL